jgi:hypothetical protein
MPLQEQAAWIEVLKRAPTARVDHVTYEELEKLYFIGGFDPSLPWG